MPNLRWKIITVVAVLLIFGTVGVYPIVASRWGLPLPQWLADKGLKLGAGTYIVQIGKRKFARVNLS